MSEKSFQGAIVEYAKLSGWAVYHTNDSRRSEPGFPDLVLVRGRRLIFAELKNDTGRLRPEQIVWMQLLGLVAKSARHVEVQLWRPTNWGEILDTLKRPVRVKR